MRRTVMILVLWVYAGAVIGVTVFPIVVRPESYYGGEPWWTMLHYIPFMVDAPSFILNILMFVPFGVLVPLLWRRADSWWRLCWTATAASAGIELVQLVIMVTVGSRRTVDVNDLIANAAGALVGLLVLRLAVPRREHRERLSSPPRVD